MLTGQKKGQEHFLFLTSISLFAVNKLNAQATTHLNSYLINACTKR